MNNLTEVSLVELGIGRNYIRCLVIVAMSMGKVFMGELTPLYTFFFTM